MGGWVSNSVGCRGAIVVSWGLPISVDGNVVGGWDCNAVGCSGDIVGSGEVLLFGGCVMLRSIDGAGVDALFLTKPRLPICVVAASIPPTTSRLMPMHSNRANFLLDEIE